MPKRAAEVGVGKLTRVNEATVACPASFSGRGLWDFTTPLRQWASIDQPQPLPLPPPPPFPPPGSDVHLRYLQKKKKDGVCVFRNVNSKSIAYL